MEQAIIKGQKYFGANQAARILGYNPTYFRSLVREGEFPGAIKSRGMWFIPIQSVENRIKYDPLLNQASSDIIDSI